LTIGGHRDLNNSAAAAGSPAEIALAFKDVHRCITASASSTALPLIFRQETEQRVHGLEARGVGGHG
jgi:hypothetical protein